MKNTYKYKNVRNVDVNGESTQNQDESSNEQAHEAHSKLVSNYLYLNNLSKDNESVELSKLTVNVEDTIAKEYDESLNKSKGGSKEKKKSKLPSILCVVVALIALVGAGGYVLHENKLKAEEQKRQQNYETFVSSIDMLYTDSSNSDIQEGVDTASFYSMLDIFTSQGFDVSRERETLVTIDSYLSDKAKLLSLNDEGINLMSDDYQAVIDEVDFNSDSNYSVNGLRMTIKSMIEEAESRVSSYKELKANIESAISNASEFDAAGYAEAVSGIQYSIQRRELEALLECGNAEKNIALIEANITEVNVPVENEDVADKKLSKDERTAKANAIAEREQKLAELNEQLSVANEVKSNAWYELYKIQDEMMGTSTAEEYKASLNVESEE